MNNTDKHIVKARHPFTEAFEMFSKNIAAVIALIVLFLIILIAIFGPTLYPVDPFDMVWMPFSPPGEEGFIYRPYTGGIDQTNVYTEGTVFIAPWNEMITYNILQQASRIPKTYLVSKIQFATIIS